MAAEESEVVDGELMEARTAATALEATRRALPPVAVAAGVAVTGVAAGMTAVTVLQRRQTRKAAKRRKKMLGKVVASKSFMVDVHVLDK
jgi:hypothetical protein